MTNKKVSNVLDTKDMQDALTALGHALTRAVHVCGPLIVMHQLATEIASLSIYVNEHLNTDSSCGTLKSVSMGEPPTSTRN
jgi:hypothetical protein